jgi:hypothetical protein
MMSKPPTISPQKTAFPQTPSKIENSLDVSADTESPQAQAKAATATKIDRWADDEAWEVSAYWDILTQLLEQRRPKSRWEAFWAGGWLESVFPSFPTFKFAAYFEAEKVAPLLEQNPRFFKIISVFREARQVSDVCYHATFQNNWHAYETSRL